MLSLVGWLDVAEDRGVQVLDVVPLATSVGIGARLETLGRFFPGVVALAVQKRVHVVGILEAHDLHSELGTAESAGVFFYRVHGVVLGGLVMRGRCSP